MTKDQANYIRRAMGSARGDDLERAESAFSGRPDLLDTLYGASGKTRREILEEYRTHRKRHDDAVASLEAYFAMVGV